MPETAPCPIWRLWMADTKEAVGRARREQAENDALFNANRRR